MTPIPALRADVAHMAPYVGEALTVYERWTNGDQTLRETCADPTDNRVRLAADAVKRLHVPYPYFKDAPAAQLAPMWAMCFIGEMHLGEAGNANLCLDLMRTADSAAHWDNRREGKP